MKIKIAIVIVISFVFGTIFGAMILNWASSYYAKSTAFMNISRVQNMTSKVYRTGEVESSIIVLNFLLDEMELYQYDLDGLCTYITDKGLVHGRLCLLFKKIGKEELADKECSKAIMLLNQKYNINTSEELIGIIKKIDSVDISNNSEIGSE